MKNFDETTYLVIELLKSDDDLNIDFGETFEKEILSSSLEADKSYYAVSIDHKDNVLDYFKFNFSDSYWIVYEVKLDPKLGKPKQQLIKQSDILKDSKKSSSDESTDTYEESDQINNEINEEINDEIDDEINEEIDDDYNDESEEIDDEINEENEDEENEDFGSKIDDSTLSAIEKEIAEANQESYDELEDELEDESDDHLEMYDEYYEQALKEIHNQSLDDESESESETEVHSRQPQKSNRKSASKARAENINSSLKEQIELLQHQIDELRNINSNKFAKKQFKGLNQEIRNEIDRTIDSSIENVDRSIAIDTDKQIEMYKKFIKDSQLNLNKLYSNEFYEQLISLQKPYADNQELYKFMKFAYDMSKINQTSVISKSKILDAVDDFEDYQEYLSKADAHNYHVNRYYSRLNKKFDMWLNDREARFLEFYQAQLDKDPNLLYAIQHSLNEFDKDLNYYSLLVADELDDLDPDLTKRRQFNQILLEAYDNSASLFEYSKKIAAEETMNLAQEVMEEKLKEQDDLHQKEIASLKQDSQRLQDTNQVVRIPTSNQPNQLNQESQSNQPENNFDEYDEFNNLNVVSPNAQSQIYGSQGDEVPNIDDQVVSPNELSQTYGAQSDSVKTPQSDEYDEIDEFDFGDDDDQSSVQHSNDYNNESGIDQTDDYEDEEIDLGFDEDEDSEESNDKSKKPSFIKQCAYRFSTLPVWKKAVSIAVPVVLIVALIAGIGMVKNKSNSAEQAYQTTRVQSMLKEVFKVGDTLILNVDGTDQLFVIKGHKEGNEIGLVAENQETKKTMDIDQNLIASYLQKDDAANKKKEEFYKEYDKKHNHQAPGADKSGEGLTVDFGSKENEKSKKDKKKQTNENQQVEQPKEQTPTDTSNESNQSNEQSNKQKEKQKDQQKENKSESTSNQSNDTSQKKKITRQEIKVEIK
jgi:hypothetical protein